VISAGRFDSFFAGKKSPLLADTSAQEEGDVTETDEKSAVDTESGAAVTTPGSVIERSSESARIILFSSNDFLQDMVIGLAGTASGGDYLNGLQLMANALDWALEDQGLLGIRARGHFNRTLPPMDQGTQVFWEYLNYALAILALGLVAVFRYQRQRARQKAFTAYIHT
jgi:ABC-2 type transport system permease protein